MWYKAIASIGAVICAVTLHQFFGLPPICAFEACSGVIEEIQSTFTAPDGAKEGHDAHTIEAKPRDEASGKVGDSLR